MVGITQADIDRRGRSCCPVCCPKCGSRRRRSKVRS